MAGCMDCVSCDVTFPGGLLLIPSRLASCLGCLQQQEHIAYHKGLLHFLQTDADVPQALRSYVRRHMGYFWIKVFSLISLRDLH